MNSLLALHPGALQPFLERVARGANRVDTDDLPPELRSGVHDNCRLEVDRQTGVAILTLSGVISPYYYWCIDPRAVVMHCEDLAADESISTVLLVVDSPGGHVTGVPEAASSIRRLSDSGKAVFAWTDTMAASAGYWLAAAADGIFAAPSADVGSVGVYSYLLDVSELFEREGIKARLFRDGKLKGLGVWGKALDEAEAAYLQEEVDAVSADFKGFVRSRRSGISDDALQGQTLTGARARAARLVDRNLDSFQQLLAVLMGQG